MAEKIVSPGVFTRENDLSFLQQGVADIGAAFIGPFLEGPAVPTIVNSQAEFETLFGKADGTYLTPLAVQNYLREAGTATICRVVGVGGYTEIDPILIHISSSNGVTASAVIFNTDTDATGFSGSTTNTTSTYLEAIIQNAELINTTASVNPQSANSIDKVFGTSPYGSKGGYTYAYFKNNILPSASIDPRAQIDVHVLAPQSFSGSYSDGSACEALTPMIQSQLIGGGRYPLFQFETLGVGNSSNTKVKIGITNIKASGAINGTDYGAFTIVVRDFNDTDKKKNILETFSNVNLDPNSPNYVARVIGDRKLSFDTQGKITEIGDWVNNSKYVRIRMAAEAPVQSIPFGHASYQLFVNANSYSGSIPKVTFLTASAEQYGGIDLDFNGDNKIYMKPIPNGAGTGVNSIFGLDVTNGGSLSVGSTLAQFVVAFQEGFDGMSPATPISKAGDTAFEVGTNSQGFNLSSATSSGTLAYGKHIAALSNTDEFDINMVVTPGVVRRLHPSVATSVLDMVEQRNDCFYIMDQTSVNDTITQAVDQSADVDSNMAATYYPWIKTIDINTNKLISVPPSVLLPGVFAANDRVAAEWFAPAGLNRGGLIGAVGVLNRLSQTEKDTLYEAKVNPIVIFPGIGNPVVFGQKTLQDKPSALDRINVRRLLLSVRKYIASTSRYLVFEQNTSTTRQAFLNIVNPYLTGIQQNQGLYAFRVVMDDSNNTPDVVDRNIMKGAIFLQPTKTAEFIQIDFNILPTGATFEG
jgi:hypothetical protein